MTGPVPDAAERDVPVPALRVAEPLPWALRKPVVAKPAGWDYGYLEGNELHPSSPQEMRDRARHGQPLHMVWTPASPWLVWPEEVPEVFGELRTTSVATAKQRIRGPLAGFVVLLLANAAIWAGSGPAPLLLVLLGIAVIWLAAGAYTLRSARYLTPTSFRASVEDAVHGSWAASRPVPWTQATAVCLGVVYAAQFFNPGSEAVAGLVKPLVWQGQGWRLFTATLMHAHILHFYFNLTALLALGRLAEVHSHRSYVPLVFLAAALTGSLFSLFLMPNITSVGASGAILGLTGFLLVIARRRRNVLPPGFLRMMAFDVGGVVALGIFGFGIIDNAAHLGGFLGGMGVGSLLVPSGESRPTVGWEPSPAVSAAGWASLAVLAVGALATATLIVTAGNPRSLLGS